MRPILAALIALALPLAAGCSDDDPDDASDPPRSTTAVTASDEVDEDLLLREQDVAAQPGLADVAAQDLAETAIENPDTRGPCGASVPPVDFEGSVARAFVGRRVSVAQFVGPADDAARAQHAALLADAVPGCEPFATETDSGAPQRVSATEILDLGFGDAAVAWLAQVDRPAGSLFAGAVSIVTADHTTFLQLLSQDPVAADVVVALGRAAAERLGLEGP